MNSYQKHAANSYKAINQTGLSDREIMVEAFRVLISHLTHARDACSARNIDTMLTYNLKTIKILDVLKEELQASSALQDPEAIPPAKFLIYTYNTLVIRLTNILGNPKPVEEFDALIEMLKPVYRAWQPPVPDTREQAVVIDSL